MPMKLKNYSLIALGLLVLALLAYASYDKIPSSETYLVTAPVECIIRSINVKSGQYIQKDHPLFSYEEKTSLECVEAARKANDLQKTEMLRTCISSVKDSKAISKIPSLRFKLKKSQVQLAFANQNLNQVTEKSPIAGLVEMDDAKSLIGREVKQGEKIMTIKPSNSRQVGA